MSAVEAKIETSTPATRVGFKKKRKKSTKTTTRSTSILESVEKDQTVEEINLEETKFLQQHRKKHKGCDTLIMDEHAEEEAMVVRDNLLGSAAAAATV